MRSCKLPANVMKLSAVRVPCCSYPVTSISMLVTPFVGRHISDALSNKLDRDARRHLMGLGCGRKMVPTRLPAMTAVMRSGSDARQMTVEQPAAVAMRAAVSLVAMPPVPHCVPRVLVSTCQFANAFSQISVHRGRSTEPWCRCVANRVGDTAGRTRRSSLQNHVCF